jgi:hypothetical protein
MTNFSDRVVLPPSTFNDMDQLTIERRIKGLTTLIYYLNPQNGPPTSCNARSANARAYHHVATLLTRGLEDGGAGRSVIAVTGAHAATGHVVTAFSSDPGPPLDEDLAKVHIGVTQNQSPPRAQPRFCREEVKPNPLSLADICKTMYVLLALRSEPSFIEVLGK